MRPCAARAEALVCASAAIELGQELTSERQAFSARLRVNNALPHLALTDVAVAVLFTGEAGEPVRVTGDPNDTNALFFVAVESMSGIADVSGSGEIRPGAGADVRWRIIPAHGAGGAAPAGRSYRVGATVSYRLGGAPQTTRVEPETIEVKPLPRLALDYFMPASVWGDDPRTAAVEPPVPGSMGLRLRNLSAGTARRVRLDTGQPEIVENSTGLRLDFRVVDCEVDGRTALPAMQADFGDVASGRCAVARWTLVSSLSGTCRTFRASVSHADELGGRLTSLLSGAPVRLHTLTHAVRVDLPGRDAVRDFLAGDSRVYESDGGTLAVADLSGSASWDGGARLIVGGVTDAAHVRIALPAVGVARLGGVVRSDGKRIDPANAWLAPAAAEPPGRWEFHLFDTGVSNSAYAVGLAPVEAANRDPVLDPIAPLYCRPGEWLRFTVRAVDPDGGVPTLVPDRLPVGARFRDCGDGTGSFEWTPSPEQAGEYRVRFRACDACSYATGCAMLTVAAGAGVEPRGALFLFR